MTERVYALQHRACGHIGIAANNRALVERYLTHRRVCMRGARPVGGVSAGQDPMAGDAT